MLKLAPEVVSYGTVRLPSGTVNAHPRQYFYIGKEVSKSEAKELEALLQGVCKHISRVTPCSTTPSSQPASFFVSYGGFDPNPQCTNTNRRLVKYTPEVHRTIREWIEQRTT